MRSPLLKVAASVPEDPTLLVSGFGVIRKTLIEKHVQRYLDDYNSLAKRGSWSSLYHYNRNGVFDAMLKTLADFQDGKIQPYPEQKLQATDAAAEAAFKQSKTVQAKEFMAGLIQAVKAIPAKTAKPEGLDQSLLYLKIEADRQNTNLFNISFFSPRLRPKDPKSLQYQIEVGGKGENQIRQSLNKLVVPQMREDILETDHAILEKVVYRLRQVVLDAARDYLHLEEQERLAFKNVVRMDIMRYQDIMVKMHDNNNTVNETIESER